MKKGVFHVDRPWELATPSQIQDGEGPSEDTSEEEAYKPTTLVTPQ